MNKYLLHCRDQVCSFGRYVVFKQSLWEQLESEKGEDIFMMSHFNKFYLDLKAGRKIEVVSLNIRESFEETTLE